MNDRDPLPPELVDALLDPALDRIWSRLLAPPDGGMGDRHEHPTRAGATAAPDGDREPPGAPGTLIRPLGGRP